MPRSMSEPPELAGVRHEYVDAGGLRVHVALAGPEDGPPVVLLHGWPQNWWAWREVIPDVAKSFRVIVPDLRGFGWSQAPPDGYEKERLTSDIFATLDALGVAQATWIGHDWGAWIGFLAALREPQRIERMLTIGIPHMWTPPHLSRLILLTYQGPISLPFVGPLVADRMARAILQAGRGRDRLSATDIDVFADHIPRAVTVAMYRTFLTREVLPFVRGRYANRKLEVPTTHFAGALDLVSKGMSNGVVRGQPNLTVQILDRVAHWIPEQRPQAIIDWAFADAA
jgi:pimeloyl-ACP methyl ester carboxylesterase